ncbi:hypothetical protein QR680_010690 [Steinernema hermaphroditum]|uniref:G-protein coupled receptors family 2 profile 2 domain-containing protein n=1 Tax=Steinernema hermaphroditum TaxID=289476 RepID=A0AA39MC77_9BILA|nr:hypothetical protein QR680_010690 [Steinernema hermaphroditum]
MFVLLMLLLLCPHALFVPFYNNMYFAYFDPNNPSNDFYFERTYLPSSNTYLYSPVDPETFPGSVIVTVTTRSSDGHKANIVYILSTTENTTVSVSSAEFVLTKFDSFQLVHSVEDGQNGEMKFKGCNKYSITCGPPSAADCEVQCDDYHICACIEPSCLDVCWTKYGPPKITNPATSPETTTSTPSTTSTSTTQTTPKQSSSATTGTSTSTTFTTTSSVSSSTSSSGTLPHTTTKSFFFSNSTDAPEISYPNADQGLKNLTNETITPYNVRHVLNQSLTYAEMGKDLNADDVTLLSLIVRNASMLSNISHNFYKMLTAVLLYISIVVPLTSTQQLICRGPVYFSYLEFAQPHSSFHLKRVLSAVPPQFTYYDVGPSSFDGTIAVWDDSGNYFSLTKVKDTVVPFQMPANLHTSFENFDLHDNIATDDDDGVTIVDHFQFSKCEAHHAVDNYQLYDCFESRICVSCEHPHQEVCPGFYNNPPATSSIASSTTKSQPTTSSTSIPSTTTSTVTTHSSTVHQTASTAPLNTTDIPFDVPSGLWNLTNTPITSDNVYSILNQSLAYAEMGDELTPDDVSLLSIIVHNASMLPDIQHDHNFIGPLDKQFHSDIAPSVYLQCNILHKDYIIYLNSDHFNSSSTDIVSRCSTRTPKLDTHPDYVPKRTSCAEKSFGFFKNAPGSISRRHHVFVAYCSQDSQSTQYQSFLALLSFTPNSAYDGLVNIFYVGQAPSGSEFFVIEIFYDPVNLQLVFQLVGNETILVGAPPEAPNSPAPSPQQLTNENNVTIDYPISGGGAVTVAYYVATLLLENVDYMQGAALETFAESNQPGKGDGTTQRIVNAVHNMVQNLQDSNFDYMTGQQLGLRAINKDNHDDDLSIGHDGEKFDSKPGDNSVASITIPKAAMDGGGRVYVAYWATNKLFIPKRITYTRSTEQSGQYITSLTHAEKCSQTLTPTGKDPVLTGTILDKSSTNSAKLAQSSKQLQAVITYDKKKALHPLHGEYKVTWWDKYFSQWARDEQCEMVSNTGRIVAHCYHLTDFTLVEDGMQNDPLVCSVPLQAIAYTLNVLSIVSLIVFMTIRATRYLRRVNQEQPSTPLQKILLNKFLQRKNANEPVVEDLMYTLFLFLFYLFFTCFKDQRVTHNGCEAMGGIAYFLFLCIPFQVFVFAIGDVALRLSYKKVGLYASPATALGVSIGLSFVITVGLGAGSDFFKRNDQFCWIRPTYVVPGIVLPLVFIFTTGIMSTACVAWAFFESRNQNNDLNSWQTRKERLLRITRIVQMQLHLGLPWIFQFASLAFPYVTAWHYLFAFTNDSQGIIHLLIFFLFDKLEAVRKDYEENRSEVDAKQVMEQEKNDRDLLENYYHKEETSVKRRTQIEFTSYAETIEEPYYSRPAATSTPVAHQKSVKTTLYDEPPGETYPEILKRISLEDRQRNSRMIELKSMDFSVEDELWDEEDLEQDTADPEQGNDSTTESSKSDGLGADEAFVNDTVDCTNSTNSGGDGDDAGTAEQNVNEPEQDGNSTTESLDSSEVELSEDNPIDYTNSTDSDGSEDENGADDAANDDGTAPEYEVIQTNPSEPEVHSPLKLKAHENAEEELNWLAGRVTDRAKDDGYDVPSKSEPTSTRNLKTESKMEDDGDLTELPQKTIIDRLPSYKPPSPPPLSTMPAITYLPLITTEPPSDDENPNVKRRWKDHLQRQDSIDESDVE